MGLCVVVCVVCVFVRACASLCVCVLGVCGRVHDCLIVCVCGFVLVSFFFLFFVCVCACVRLLGSVFESV